ncbi:MAG: endonuclease/exonuclease/phosphatase family protein [Candidatus Hodarchaeota archaeon]
MKKPFYFVFGLGILTFLLLSLSFQGLSVIGSVESISSNSETRASRSDILGVVILDDEHSNDYTTNDNLRYVVADLQSMGYVTYFSSELGGWLSALSYADYFIITTPMDPFTTGELSILSTWLNNGSHNLLMSSRGDYNDYERASLNDLLSHIGSHIRVQDDNVYTTDSHNWQGNAWYAHTGNFNETTLPQLFENVTDIEFYSGDSLQITDYSVVDVLVNGTPHCYQTNQNPPPPAVIYDDTDDDVGGDRIPMAAHEILSIGTKDDRVIVFGSTMWSDFDYDDEVHDDIALFRNIMKYFNDETKKAEGVFTGAVPDFDTPIVKISFPRDNSIVFGSINITVSVIDKGRIASYEIFINSVSKATTSYYNWDTTAESDGTYNITAEVTDEAGHVGKATHLVTVNQNYVPTHNSHVKVLAYNIKESGTDPHWRDVVKEENADIMVLSETGDFDDNNNALLNQYISEFNGYFIDEKTYQGYTEQNVVSPWQGISILSRFNILTSKTISNLTLDNGTTLSPQINFVEAKVDVHGVTVYVIGAHLMAGSGYVEERELEMEGIINYMDALGDVAIVFAGDFNCFSPLDTGSLAPIGTGLGTEPIAMLMNNSHEHASAVHNWTDAFRSLNPSDKGYTYGNQSRIDYVFLNHHLDDKMLSSTTGDTESAYIGSDHLSVDVVLDFSAYVTTTPTTTPTSTSITTATPTTTATTTTTTTTSSPGFTLITTLLMILVIPVIFTVRRSRRSKN